MLPLQPPTAPALPVRARPAADAMLPFLDVVLLPLYRLSEAKASQQFSQGARQGRVVDEEAVALAVRWERAPELPCVCTCTGWPTCVCAARARQGRVEASTQSWGTGGAREQRRLRVRGFEEHPTGFGPFTRCHCAMQAGAKSLSVPILGHDNWPLWSVKARAYLYFCDLWKAVEPQEGG